MTARHQRRCRTGKRRYRDEISAMLSLATLKRRDVPDHEENRAYHCAMCGGWHLTKQDLRSARE